MAARRMLAVQEQAAGDPEYLALLEEYHGLSGRLLSLLERLPTEDSAVVEDYLGLTGEMHRKLLEFSCK